MELNFFQTLKQHRMGGLAVSSKRPVSGSLQAHVAFEVVDTISLFYGNFKVVTEYALDDMYLRMIFHAGSF